MEKRFGKSARNSDSNSRKKFFRREGGRDRERGKREGRGMEQKEKEIGTVELDVGRKRRWNVRQFFVFHFFFFINSFGFVREFKNGSF